MGYVFASQSFTDNNNLRQLRLAAVEPLRYGGPEGARRNFTAKNGSKIA